MSISPKSMTRQLPTPLAFSIEEAASLLGISESSVRLQLKSGRIRSIKVGRRVLIPRNAVMGLFEREPPQL